ncbi:unnamed protein product, partial [Rotaria sp. Silwood2]
VVRKLKEYQQQGYLNSTTLFIVFDVADLYTMIPRDGAIAALTRFCEKYAINGKIGTLKISTVIQLACVVLDTNSFAYKDKYYRQIKGGYIDDVFMTSNLSKEEILKLLDETTQTDSNIKITTTISQSLDYLDVTIENNNGNLKTCIYHKSASEPYILPYSSDHPRHVHMNILNNALVRAARMCSTVEDFDMERLSIEMILLVNGYPPKFIQQHMKNFFMKYNAMNVWTELNT